MWHSIHKLKNNSINHAHMIYFYLDKKKKKKKTTVIAETGEKTSNR
jgi:hypothetical protein